jgi:hypothetical protein
MCTYRILGGENQLIPNGIIFNIQRVTIYDGPVLRTENYLACHDACPSDAIKTHTAYTMQDIGKFEKIDK